MVWNCQEAGSRKFRRALQDLVSSHRPSILILLETWVEFAREEDFAVSLGFSGSLIVDPIGFSGGIWFLWTTPDFHVTLLQSSRQFIHASVCYRHEDPWLLTAIYASPTTTMRQSLWSALEQIATASSLPWLLVGDFNVIADPSERCGELIASSPLCRRFVNTIHACQLLDLGFVGSPFTFARGTVRKRLDRGLCNEVWRTRFLEAFLRHME
ncbi:hypothetical protein Tsubulata_051520, partial [Turnera subulata]